jgi:hypothetical protein
MSALRACTALINDARPHRFSAAAPRGTPSTALGKRPEQAAPYQQKRRRFRDRRRCVEAVVEPERGVWFEREGHASGRGRAVEYDLGTPLPVRSQRLIGSTPANASASEAYS